MLKGLILGLLISVSALAQTGINKSLVFTAGDSISAAVCLTPGSYPVGMWADSLTTGSITVKFKVAFSRDDQTSPVASKFYDLAISTDTTSYTTNLKIGKYFPFPEAVMLPLKYASDISNKTEAKYVWLKAVLPVKQTIVSKSINIRLGK
jgi:hypothetical protein